MRIPKKFEELVILFLEKRTTSAQQERLESWLQKDNRYRKYFNEINTAFQLGIALSLKDEKIKNAWESISGRINSDA